jgi:hypothetical protein
VFDTLIRMHTLNINNPMKVSNIKYSTMIVCGSYMFEFSARKDMKKWLIKGGESREGSGTFVSNSNCQGIEN